MGKRKRTSRRSGLVDRAVTAGRRALREAESRVPADLRRQFERRVRDANKTVQAAIKQAQVQVKRASSRSDVNSVLKRLDDLTKQARQLARGTPARGSSTRRPASRTKGAAAPRRTTARRPTTRRAAAPKTPAAPPARTTTRKARARRRAATTPTVQETPMAPEMGMPTPHEPGEPPSFG